MAAQVVDHIIPHRGDPSLMWDESNWQSLCKPCHDSKTAGEGGRVYTKVVSKFVTATTLVCGPPGSGKSGYVTKRARWGDLIVDFDALAAAMTGLPLYDRSPSIIPFVAEARDALIRRLCRPSGVRHAWIIHGGAKQAERQSLIDAGAKLVMLEVPAVECIRRISQDPRRAARWELWKPIVEQWWATYERE